MKEEDISHLDRINVRKAKELKLETNSFFTLTAGRAIFLVHGSALMIDAWVPRWW